MKVRKTFLVDEGLVEVIKKLKKDNHYNSETAVIIEAVMSLNRKLNPGYVVSRAETRAKTPEQKLDEEDERKRIKKQREEDAQMVIVNALEGRVSIGAGGGKVVKYYTYDRKNRYQQQLPIDMMSEDLIASQYFPTKEDVLARQAKGEVNYDPKTWE